MPFHALFDGRHLYLPEEDSPRLQNQGFTCPHCGEEMIYVRGHERLGRGVLPHFRHKAECPYHSEPESRQHLTMKATMKRLLEEDNPTMFVKLEQRIGNHIADLVLDGVAVECQVSPISVAEMQDRTFTYHKRGFHTLWVFYFQNKFRTDDRVWLPAYMAEVRRWYRWNLFFFDERHGFPLMVLRPFRLSKVYYKMNIHCPAESARVTKGIGPDGYPKIAYFWPNQELPTRETHHAS